MAQQTDRRGFLSRGAITAGAVAAGKASISSQAGAEPRISYKRTSPASPELVKVGVVAGRSTHTKNIWYRFMNPAVGTPRRTGLIVTHYWTHWDAIVDDFEKKTGAQRVNNLEDMIGKVDGVIVDEGSAVNIQHLLAKPYVEAGIPTFMNRPFTSCVNKGRMLLDIARKNDTPLMCGSSFEYVKEAAAANKYVERDKVRAYEAYNSSSDYYTHGLHGMWFAYRCFGGGVSRVSTLSKKWWKGPALTSIEHKPRVADGQPIYGIVRHGSTGGGNCGIRVYSDRCQEFINTSEGTGDVRDQSLWTPMLIAIEKMFITGEMPEPYENILEKTRIFLASFYSLLELDGAPVEMDSFDDGWDAGPRKVEHYPGNSYTPAELADYEKVAKGS
ncbi:hypothetical protein ACFL60_01780 [Candidatus Omnitrophota bacterium]